MVENSDYIVTSTPFADWYIPPDASLRAYVGANFRLHAGGGLLFLKLRNMVTGTQMARNELRI